MALNASGPISLGGSTAGQSINLELGQSATAQVSLNDTNVRSLAGVASGAIVMPTNFYGKAASSNSITIFDGTQTSGTISWDGYGSSTAITGAPANFGSISGTSAVTVFGGATLLDCFYQADSSLGTKYVILVVSGNQTGTTWSSMTIDGTAFTKAAMGGAGTYNSGGNYTIWSKTSGVSSDPFTSFPTTVVFA